MLSNIPCFLSKIPLFKKNLPTWIDCFTKLSISRIGKNLINFSIELGKEKKYHRIRLESGNQRVESHKFYKHLGFENSSMFFTKNL